MIYTSSKPAGYDGVWRSLHWLMAVLFIVNVGIGYYASTIPAGVAPRPALLDVHKSIGVTLFVLVLIRLIWRWTHPHPPLPTQFGPATRIASAVVHGVLYILMLGMPLSGYIDSIAGGHPFLWFGLFPVPILLERNKSLGDLGEKMHLVGAYAVYALVSLHIAAALWHGFRRDGVLSRMLPARP